MEMKFDNNKPRMDLIEPEFLEGLAKVLTHGASKYAPDSWKTEVSEPERRYYAAALRHLAAWKKGEKTDPESGLSHIHHAACNLMFLGYFDKQPSVDNCPVKTLIEFEGRLYAVDSNSTNMPLAVSYAYNDALNGMDFEFCENMHKVRVSRIGIHVREARQRFYTEDVTILFDNHFFHVSGPDINLPRMVELAYLEALDGKPLPKIEKERNVHFFCLGHVLKRRDELFYGRIGHD